MSVARHHAEWLSLVETSGPFLSMPVLLRVFPQGLEQRNTAKAHELRDAYEDWLDRGEKHPVVHQAWVRHVIDKVLEYPLEFLAEGQAIPPAMEATMANYGETLRPDFVLKHRDSDHKPLLLIQIYPFGQDLEKPVSGKLWKASPGTRMMELLHAADVPLGLITNGEEWMLISAPRGETTGFASWYADLWMQEPITLRAFHSLLHLRRLVGVAESDTLAFLYAESSKDQQEVTDQLGYQVRRAVEMLVQAFDRIDLESGRALLAGVPEKELYDSALTLMMRLVFLFSAEERGLLLLGDPLYDQHYALSTLSELLRDRADQHGEEVLERRHDAWCRLLATFRAVHGGVEHESMRLPPYGGTLFDPDRYPFLEGRAADTHWRTSSAQPLPVNNRVVLHLLEALQLLRVKVPGGGPAEARRLSFRALDVEQIGHVYEGLLDHTAKRAGEVVLGLFGSRKAESEIALSKLEGLREKGGKEILEFLEEETGRKEKALRKAFENSELVDEHVLIIACGQNAKLAQRVRPFAGFLRQDDFGQLMIIPEGSFYVTRGSDRRSTGTHYTPRSLTEPIVRYTLEPLVYVGPAEGKPQAEWELKSSKDLLALKVCDMAMGSGAFLVQVCRYLAERLVEAWEEAEKANPGKILSTPEGDFSEGNPAERIIPVESAERIAVARRYVADRCLYGVDINPMAVEMAKLSLWLITLQRDRPFTFLDHAFKCGDSLLGVTSVKQIENFSLRAKEGDQIEHTFATANLFRYLDEASTKRRALEDLPSNDYGQVDAKNRLNAEAEASTAKIKALADCLIAFELCGLDGDAYKYQRAAAADKADAAMRKPLREFQAYALEQLRGRRLFHWAVEFPEVFARGGFDAITGNPPYLGGPKLTGTFGRESRDFWIKNIALGKKGTADLAAYFCLRTVPLIAKEGNVGFVVTSSVAEGDTREVGLQQLVDNGAVLFCAVQRKPWPGTAKVTYTAIWFRFGEWNTEALLDGRKVRGITSYLTERGDATTSGPFKLIVNSMRSYNGAKVYGEGFVIDAEEREALLARDPKNAEVIFPYMTTDDLNSRPDCTPSQWAIRFFEWPLDRASAEENYRGPVASDYPDCLAIVEARVKPERTRRNERGEFVLGAPLPQKWWIYGRTRPALYGRLEKLDRTLAIGTQATKYVAFALISSKTVFSHSLAIVASDSFSVFAALSSSLHEVWARRYGSYNLALLRYSPSDLFDTFPLPEASHELDKIGSSYYQHRHEQMLQRVEGLTDIYNHFHEPGERSQEIALLRTLHVKMDQVVAASYGWSDLDLGHGFYETKQGIRYTTNEAARRIVLDRLLVLNHLRYEEEVKAGLHEKKKTKAKMPKKQLEPISRWSKTTADNIQFGLGIATGTSIKRSLPTEFRLSAADPTEYAVSLVFALLSEAGGSLPLPRLRDAFVLATSPQLMVRLAAPDESAEVKAWAQRWQEAATPDLFLGSLRAMGKHHLTVSQGAGGRIFQLLDGPRAPANADVGYDAWLALRVAETLAPSTILTPECTEWTKEAEALVLA